MCRDGAECVICHKGVNLQIAHYIGRAQGGLGIEENLVVLCVGCHIDYDNGDKRRDYADYIRNYLKWHYTDWNEGKLKYKKEV